MAFGTRMRSTSIAGAVKKSKKKAARGKAFGKAWAAGGKKDGANPGGYSIKPPDYTRGRRNPRDEGDHEYR